jgi:hypothetical protein
MGKTKLVETYIFKINIKIWFFWCIYWYQNSIFRASVTIESGRPYLQFVTTNYLIEKKYMCVISVYYLTQNTNSAAATHCRARTLIPVIRLLESVIKLIQTRRRYPFIEFDLSLVSSVLIRETNVKINFSI